MHYEGGRGEVVGFVDTFKTELIADRVSTTQTQLELAIVEWVAWFNNDRLHGIPPRRARRRAARCLVLAEREEISRGIARGDSDRQIARQLGRSHTTIAREIERCGGRRR